MIITVFSRSAIGSLAAAKPFLAYLLRLGEVRSTPRCKKAVNYRNFGKKILKILRILFSES